MTDLLKDFWAIVMFFIGGIMWLARLEAAMLANRNAIRRLEDQIRLDAESDRKQMNRLDDKLDGVQASLRQILLILGQKEDKH